MVSYCKSSTFIYKKIWDSGSVYTDNMEDVVLLLDVFLIEPLRVLGK